MPTTPNGTTYTLSTADLGVHGAAYWAVADAEAGSADLPFVLYCHGAGGGANQFATLAAWSGLRNWLIDNGFGWVEGLGGGLQPWGNPASEHAYDAAFAHVDGLFDIGSVVVLGRSMGGAVASRLYHAHRGTDPRFVGLISNSGVSDLAWAYDYDGGRWTDAFNTAWGVTSKPEFLAAVTGLNPIDGPASAWAGASVLQMWGDVDTTVTPADNAIAMRTMYAGSPTLDVADVRAGGDHSAANGSYQQVDAMAAFLAEVTGMEPPPPPTPTMYRADTGIFLSLGGERYALSPR